MNRWHSIRKWWAIIGTIAFLLFSGWSAIAYQTWGVSPEVLTSDATVTVRETDEAIFFTPSAAPAGVSLLFFPGALVDPRAYAPLVRRMAVSGHPSMIVKVPFRGAFGLGDPGEVSERARRLTAEQPCVIAGHSKGALFAVEFAAAHPDLARAVILIGSSHPRHRDVSKAAMPFTKIYGTKDGLAGPARVQASASNLPQHTRWVRVEGGNHSQFGYYGFQPGDRFATISRAQQQRIVEAEILRLLR